jgi:hypothetical protein
LERKLESLLKGENDEVIASPERIQESLNSMQLAAVTTANNVKMFIKAKTDPLCTKIFKIMKIKIPMNISTHSELSERLELYIEPGNAQLSLF